MTGILGTGNNQPNDMPGNRDVIITDRSPNTPHNFGPASSKDETLFTCERPGGDPAVHSNHNLQDVKIPTSSVEMWIGFMKSRGIKHIVILLDDNELECYESPGLLEFYTRAGFYIHRTRMAEAGAAKSFFDIISQVESKGEKAVAHCTHGMGRSGRVAAGWLVMKFGISPEEATRIAIGTARNHGMERMGNVSALEKW
eukprot:CAMPEP_0195247220 /NCGR_PEP_ID=MMETSP0706-20130129/843_1 /TAXON_ID=33640 /ORGANISM="Asterionellopsis glacialis, Strain CCMP134" /LENGTH=198 /DNA_ID=CAMNT_0040298695 /DNA_START=21 /DNA_END=614 /DNA_ORIENTATION=-